MKETKGWYEWLYLAASIAASYYIIQVERGSDSDIGIKIRWNAVKFFRGVRLACAEAELKLIDGINRELEARKTI